MFRNMVTSLFKYDRIRTTDAKAKELRRWADRLITLAKRGDLHARRQALAILREKEVVHSLFEQAAERFGASAGGYTRIVKLGRRPGDAAPVSLVELITAEAAGKKKKTKKKKAGTAAGRKKKAAGGKKAVEKPKGETGAAEAKSETGADTPKSPAAAETAAKKPAAKTTAPQDAAPEAAADKKHAKPAAAKKPAAKKTAADDENTSGGD
jgi:large subunit ribosomal protein L17